MARRDYIHEIQTVSRHGYGSLDGYVRAQGVRPPMTTGTEARYARVEHGRWLVDCPDCNNCLFADPDDRRMFCTVCLNALHGGGWLPVVFPDDVAAFESELLRRPIENRNWLPGETLDDLKVENVAFGVADVETPSVETAYARVGFSQRPGFDLNAMLERAAAERAEATKRRRG